MLYNKTYEQADYLVHKIEENLRCKRKNTDKCGGYARINSKILTIKLPPRKVPPVLSNSIHAKIVKKCGGVCSGQVVPTSEIAHGPNGKLLIFFSICLLKTLIVGTR